MYRQVGIVGVGLEQRNALLAILPDEIERVPVSDRRTQSRVFGNFERMQVPGLGRVVTAALGFLDGGERDERRALLNVGAAGSLERAPDGIDFAFVQEIESGQLAQAHDV